MQHHGLSQRGRGPVATLTDRKMSEIIECSNTSNSKDKAQDNWTKSLIELMLSK
jgi:hypothetical protein